MGRAVAGRGALVGTCRGGPTGPGPGRLGRRQGHVAVAVGRVLVGDRGVRLMSWSNSNLPWAEFERRLSGREPIVVDPVTIDYGDGSDTPAHVRKRERYQAPPDVVRGESTVDYVELHCHTNFSFLDGASQPEALVQEGGRIGVGGGGGGGPAAA